jgi:hypothetical protein
VPPQRRPRLRWEAESHGRAPVGRVGLSDEVEGQPRVAEALRQSEQLRLVAHGERDGASIGANGDAGGRARSVDRLGDLHPEGEVFPEDDVVVQRLGVNAWGKALLVLRKRRMPTVGVEPTGGRGSLLRASRLARRRTRDHA